MAEALSGAVHSAAEEAEVSPEVVDLSVVAARRAVFNL